MDFITTVSKVYDSMVVVCCLSAIFNIDFNFTSNNRNDAVETKETDMPRWERWLRVFLIGIMVIIATIFIVVVIFGNKPRWLILPIAIIGWLERNNEAYESFQIVKTTLKSSPKHDLTHKEKFSLCALAMTIVYIDSYKISEKIVEMLKNITNQYISDLLVAICLTLIVSIYFFMIGAVLINPVKAILRLGHFIYVKTSKKNIIWKIDCFFEKELGKTITNFKSIRFIKKYRKINIVGLIIVTILLSILDIVLTLFLFVVRLFVEILYYVFLIIKRVYRVFKVFYNWIMSVSEWKIVTLSFRSSLIFSLLVIVIYNRYFTVFKLVENSTGVYEFIASAIIIPIILSWVMELKNNKTKTITSNSL